MFVQNAKAAAAKAMSKVNASLVEKYSSLIEFLSIHPEAASKLRGRSAPEVGTLQYIEAQASAFHAARLHRNPEKPATIPDEMVSVILNEYFGIEAKELERVKHEHLLSMGAENMVGDLLERYLAGIMEPAGWIWCSGSMVKAVDFVKPPAGTAKGWRLLQVKNRDNSENSSSSAIRIGTDIEKWHRTFSRKAGANWDAFPDAELRKSLSEKAFKDFVRSYLRGLR